MINRGSRPATMINRTTYGGRDVRALFPFQRARDVLRPCSEIYSRVTPTREVHYLYRRYISSSSSSFVALSCPSIHPIIPGGRFLGIQDDYVASSNRAPRVSPRLSACESRVFYECSMGK